MKVVARIADLRAAVAEARRTARPIALVPTMGALHAGHLTLVERARGEGAFVVVSIFVNPLQFGPSEDFTRYPRDMERDSKAAQGARTDLLFVPETSEMYAGETRVVITPRVAADVWEGAIRPGHFEGVLTVVAKLFNIVQPDIAVFGQKDVQQATLIAGMVRALDFPIRLVIAPIVREADGLAMSSRNVYLSSSDRMQALVLSRALRAVEAAWKAGTSDGRALERVGLDVIGQSARVVPDYFAVVEPTTLGRVTTATPGSVVIVAARVGPTRLIDNLILGEPRHDEDRGHPIAERATSSTAAAS